LSSDNTKFRGSSTNNQHRKERWLLHKASTEDTHKWKSQLYSHAQSSKEVLILYLTQNTKKPSG